MDASAARLGRTLPLADVMHGGAPWQRGAWAALAGLVALGLAVPVPMLAGFGLWGLLLGFAGALVALLLPGDPVRAEGVRSRLAGRLVLLLLVALAVLAGAFLLAAQPSDFGIYWRCGLAAGMSLPEWLEACQSAYLPASSVFWRRSLFYTAPILALADGSYLGLRAANAALLILAFVALHRAALTEGGARFALVALLAAAIGPELWFALPLAASDHVAVPCIILGLAAMAAMQRGNSPWWVGVGLGVMIFLAEQARGVGLLFFLVLGLLVLLGRGRWQDRLIGVGLALASHVALTLGLQALLAGLPPNPGGMLHWLAVRDLERPNDFPGTYQMLFHVWPIVPADLATAFGLARITAEVTGNAGHVFAYLADRLAVTFGGHGYYFFASVTLPDSPDSALTATPSLTWSSAVHPYLGLLMRPVMGAAVVGAVMASDRPLPRAALLWVAVFLLLVVGVSEVQPRYVVLIWPAIAILAAAPFLPGPSGFARLRRGTPGVFGAGAVLATLGLYAMLAPLARPSVGWSFTAASSAATPQCPPARLDIANRSVTLHLPPDSPCAVLRLPVPPGWREAGFAVSRGELVWLFQQPEPFPLTHRFGAEGPALSLGRQVAAWHAVPLPPDGADLLVRLDRVAPGAAAWVIHLPIRLPTP